MTGRRFFVYAPPLKGTRESKRKPIQAPYKDAPTYKCSVFYYWWEYLRRHEGYSRTCANGGKGRYAKLFADFGDVHATDFWSWWRTHSELFSEPLPRQVEVVEASSKCADNTVLITVPLENRAALSVRQFRRLIEPLVSVRKQAITVSRARFPVATKPHLPSLHQHLLVWDAKRENPEADDADIADLAGIAINRVVDGETVEGRKSINRAYDDILRILRRRKQLATQRHLRIAAQYIENVGKGQFPLREGR